MNHSLQTVLNFFLLIPAVLGAINFKKIHQRYHVFIVYLWVGVLNEIISKITEYIYRTNRVNSNIYNLIEALMVTWIFYNWKTIRSKLLCIVLLTIIAVGWIADNFYFEKQQFNSWFTMFYSFYLVILSILHMNGLIAKEKRKLSKNGEFIVCVCFIVLFMYTNITEISWEFSETFSDAFRTNTHNVFVVVNCLINLSLTYAILCMPEKIRFTMEY